MFERVLIANRGEIALRVARTCRRLGVQPVLIFTDADRSAPHARAELTREVASYLDIDAVVAAALDSGAQAIHPGYGFLSERAELALAVERAGLVLIGPSAAVMQQMGRKDAAREIATAAGVPVVPTGVDGGFPVLVKAAAGGGGKGMRIVSAPEELEAAAAAAQREALAAFGDDTLLVERYVERGRHVEVQVLGDAHGSVVHLFERDCSTQRRHQKVIEEAPAPTIDEALRARLTSAAVALARQVGYTGAGTVEFLVDSDTGEFYFLEMNTRLQVEHPVTEAICVRADGSRLDLVEQQLLVAAGEPLGFVQDDLSIEGHAIEARIYAEDAFGGFLPQAGTAESVRWPGPELARVDHALESGQVIGTGFDPMLGKIVVHAPDREQARRRLIAALDATAIFGLTTNVGFLRQIAAGAAFREATIDTAWLDHQALSAPDDSEARALAGSSLAESLAARPPGPWQPDGFRVGGPRGPLIEEGRRLPLPSHGSPAGAGFVRRTAAGTEVIHHGQRFVFGRGVDRTASTRQGSGSVSAPMPGTVLSVSVAVGQDVRAGDTLGTIEAMKMELTLTAPFDGTLAEVSAVAGARVSLGAPLFLVEPVVVEPVG